MKARKKASDVRPLIPFATPWTNVEITSGTEAFALSDAAEAPDSLTPTSSSQPWNFSDAAFAWALIVAGLAANAADDEQHDHGPERDQQQEDQSGAGRTRDAVALEQAHERAGDGRDDEADEDGLHDRRRHAGDPRQARPATRRRRPAATRRRRGRGASAGRRTPRTAPAVAPRRARRPCRVAPSAATRSSAASWAAGVAVPRLGELHRVRPLRRNAAMPCGGATRGSSPAWNAYAHIDVGSMRMNTTPSPHSNGLDS